MDWSADKNSNLRLKSIGITDFGYLAYKKTSSIDEVDVFEVLNQVGWRGEVEPQGCGLYCNTIEAFADLIGVLDNSIDIRALYISVMQLTT